jgi:hypothetical protein
MGMLRHRPHASNVAVVSRLRNKNGCKTLIFSKKDNLYYLVDLRGTPDQVSLLVCLLIRYYQVALTGGPIQLYLSGLPDSEWQHTRKVFLSSGNLSPIFLICFRPGPPNKLSPCLGHLLPYTL